MIAWAAIGLIAAMVEVRTVEAEGVERGDLEAIVQEVVASLKRGGHEVCWRSPRREEPRINLSAEDHCGSSTGSEIIEISSFGAVSRVRVLLVRVRPSGEKLGEAETDVAKDDPTPLRAALARLIPPAPAIVPRPPSITPEEPVWPVAVGIGGLVAGTVGAGFLAGAFATRAGIGGPGMDPIELESIESRKGVFAAIGGGLLGVGIGAVLVYAFASNEP